MPVIGRSSYFASGGFPAWQPPACPVILGGVRAFAYHRDFHVSVRRPPPARERLDNAVRADGLACDKPPRCNRIAYQEAVGNSTGVKVSVS